MANSRIHKGKPRYMGRQSNAFDCYIENKSLPAGDKGRKIPILFSPSDLSDNVSANFNQQAIPGGSAPAITYSGTGARTVSISFFVPIDYLPPSTSFNNTEEYLNALRALVYPKYESSYITSPNCVLHLTNITIDGVCTACNISYKTDQRYGNDGALGADVSLSFMEVLSKALSNNEVSGRTTILVGTEVGTYQEASLRNGTTRSRTSTFSWGNFKLKGDQVVRSNFKQVRYSSPWYNSQYAPKYNDVGYVTYSGDYSIVKFYFASPYPISFTGNNILGNNGEGKSPVYKICINGDSFVTSNRTLQRNQVPELTAQQIMDMQSQGDGNIYFYYVYVPYLGLNTYSFSRAQIRTVICEGGVG